MRRCFIMSTNALVGIAREPCFCHDVDGADQRIFDATVAALGHNGAEVVALTAAAVHDGALEELGENIGAIFTMVRGNPLLGHLQRYEQYGVAVINSCVGTENCQRLRAYTRMEDAGVPVAPFHCIATADGMDGIPHYAGGYWIKRRDQHFLGAGDVLYAPGRDRLADHLASFAQRGLNSAIVQQHVEGALIKFYGVYDRIRDCPLFFFTPPEERLSTSQRAALEAAAFSAAKALDVEVFGGDCVVGHRSIAVIDLNSWPSFRHCCSEAAAAIAQLIFDRVAAGPNVNPGAGAGACAGSCAGKEAEAEASAIRAEAREPASSYSTNRQAVV